MWGSFSSPPMPARDNKRGRIWFSEESERNGRLARAWASHQTKQVFSCCANAPFVLVDAAPSKFIVMPRPQIIQQQMPLMSWVISELNLVGVICHWWCAYNCWMSNSKLPAWLPDLSLHKPLSGAPAEWPASYFPTPSSAPQVLKEEKGNVDLKLWGLPG